MNKLTYAELLEKQREEFENFPIAYAFGEEQLQEALTKLGAEKSECVSIMGHGDIVKRTDAPKLLAMMDRHIAELRAALLANEEWAEAAFLYEMDNHEYAINWDGDAEVLACFSLTEEKLVELGLENAYQRARNAHMEHARQWEMI